MGLSGPQVWTEVRMNTGRGSDVPGASLLPGSSQQDRRSGKWVGRPSMNTDFITWGLGVVREGLIAAVQCSVMAHTHMRRKDAGSETLENSREETIALLKDAYADGWLDRHELDERLHVAISTRSTHILAGLVDRTPVPAPVNAPDPNRKLLAGLVAACAVGALVVVAALAGSAGQYSSDDSICLSTGLSSELGCSPQSEEQLEIERHAQIAEDAVSQIRELDEAMPGDSDMTAALSTAEAAAAQANDAAREARAIMVHALGTEPLDGAFESALLNVRTASGAAVEALHDAQRIVES